jgi:hypothetical protein
MIPRLALSIVLALLASCASLPFGGSRYELDSPAEVPAAIEAARRDLETGKTEKGLERIRAAREVRGTTPEVRDEIELLLESLVTRRTEELSRPGSDPSELADLAELDLPQQLAVSAAVASARLYLDQGRPYKAYRVLEKLETRFPRHHGRAQAGEILAEAGLKLARSDGGWWLWSDRDDGLEVLEFLVLTYPSERRCDAAFAELARMYEQDRQYRLAIDRHEELLLSHSDSPLVPASRARVPHVRLAAIESPEYDRKELLRARSEIEAWLSVYDDQDLGLEHEVRVDYADCLHRLVESDLRIARFYRRISQPYGARFHAARALAVAREANNADLVRRSESLLASLPEVSELPGEIRGVDSAAFSHDESELRSTRPTPPPAEPPEDPAKPPTQPGDGADRPQDRAQDRAP